MCLPSIRSRTRLRFGAFTHNSNGRTFLRPFALVLIVLVACSGFAQESDEAKSPATNLDVMRSLARTIAATIVKQLDVKDSLNVHVAVLPKESAWYIEGGILDELKRAKLSLSDEASSVYVLEFGLRDARVQYSNIRRDGFLGAKCIDRKITLRLTTTIANRLTGIPAASSDAEESLSDTIELSDVSKVENPVIAITKGPLPNEEFMVNLAVPLILVGSIAVAVILLFNVRS